MQKSPGNRTAYNQHEFWDQVSFGPLSRVFFYGGMRFFLEVSSDIMPYIGRNRALRKSYFPGYRNIIPEDVQ